MDYNVMVSVDTEKELQKIQGMENTGKELGHSNKFAVVWYN